MVTNIRLKKVFRYLRQRPADSAIYMYIHIYMVAIDSVLL